MDVIRTTIRQTRFPGTMGIIMLTLLSIAAADEVCCFAPMPVSGWPSPVVSQSALAYGYPGYSMENRSTADYMLIRRFLFSSDNPLVNAPLPEEVVSNPNPASVQPIGSISPLSGQVVPAAHQELSRTPSLTNVPSSPPGFAIRPTPGVENLPPYNTIYTNPYTNTYTNPVGNYHINPYGYSYGNAGLPSPAQPGSIRYFNR